MLLTYDLTHQEVSDIINDGKPGKVTLKCKVCAGDFQRNKSEVRTSLKLGKQGLYCSAECHHTTLRLDPRTCKACDKEYQPSDSQQIYCSRSCAAKINNVLYPKRGDGTLRAPKTCKCGGQMSFNSSLCRKCHTQTKKRKALEEYLGRTVGFYKVNKTAHHFSVGVRKKSRQVADELYKMEKVCAVCGYDLYVELCHIKPIASFPDDALMREVNARENLVYLCPNHHKELDLGFLDMFSHF